VLTLINSTVSGNSTHFYGSAAIHAVSTGTVTLKNSILANGSSGGNCYLSGILTSFGHNLSDDVTCALSGTGDMECSAGQSRSQRPAEQRRSDADHGAAADQSRGERNSDQPD
jgi:hypothetical protein